VVVNDAVPVGDGVPVASDVADAVIEAV